jgi:hypothetical protein
MSLDDFRRQAIERLQEMASNHTTAAVNVRAAQYTTVDQLALQQVEMLSEARAYMKSAQVVHEIFVKMTRPQQDEPEATPDPKKKEDIY